MVKQYLSTILLKGLIQKDQSDRAPRGTSSRDLSKTPSQSVTTLTRIIRSTCINFVEVLQNSSTDRIGMSVLSLYA